MDRLFIKEKPYNNIIPKGISLPSSTLISGEGGSGKPLIGLKFVSNWLKSGGGVVFILTSMDKDFFKKSLKVLYDIDIDEYLSKIFFIEFDPNLNKNKLIKKNHSIKLNLVMPQNWQKGLNYAFKEINFSERKILVFGAALNLFLFSPTYSNKINNFFIDLLKNPNKESYLFAVSSSVLYEKIEKLEKVVDNLLYTYMDDWKITLKAKRINQKKGNKNPENIFLNKKHLKEIKKIAMSGRNKLIPQIRKI